MCTPCTFRNEHVTPINWCIVCRDGLCKHCSNYHKSSKSLKWHDIIPFKDRRSLPDFVQSIQDTCFEHKRQLEFFCSEHQNFHCIKCNTLDHMTCNNVLPLEDVVRNAKSSVAFCHIEDDLNVLLSKFETILNKSEESITNNAAQINEIRNNVNQIKNRIYKTLEDAIGEFLSKLDKLKSDGKTKAQETIRGLIRKRNVILDLKANVALLKENGTDLQIYLCLKHLESNLTKEDNNLSADINNGHYDCEELMFRPSEAINTLKLVGSIGEIEVQQKPLKVHSGGMGQSVKVVQSLKDSMSYKTDQVINKYRPYLAVVARLCIISVFLYDCMVSSVIPHHEYYRRFKELRLDLHLVDIFVKLTISGQMVGCIMVLLRRKIKSGCGIILLIKISQIYVTPSSVHQTPERMMSIFGIVLMAFADSTGGKSLFASTSSTLSAKNWIGKILILLMYVPLLLDIVDSSSWIRLVCGLCLIVSTTVGYRINVSAAVMIVWLLFGNLPFAGQTDFFPLDFKYVLFINTLMISGGLLLMLAHGSENIALKKET